MAMHTSHNASMTKSEQSTRWEVRNVRRWADVLGQVGASSGRERATWARSAASSGGGAAVDQRSSRAAAVPRGRATPAPGAASRSRRRAPRPDALRAAGPDFSPSRHALRRVGVVGWCASAAGHPAGAGGSFWQRAHEQTEGEGEHHQLPVAHNRPLGAHLIIRPAQFMLDRLVVVLDPVAQAVDLIDLLGADLRQGQGGHQIPGGLGLEVDGIKGGGDEAHALVGP